MNNSWLRIFLLVISFIYIQPIGANELHTPLHVACLGFSGVKPAIIELISQFTENSQFTLPLELVRKMPVVVKKSYFYFVCFEKQDEKEALQLIQKGVLNDVPADELMPLHMGVINGFTRLVKVLIRQGANVNTPCKKGHRPLDYAIQVKNPDIVKLLLQAGAHQDKKTYIILCSGLEEVIKYNDSTSEWEGYRKWILTAQTLFKQKPSQKTNYNTISTREVYEKGEMRCI